MDLLRRTQCFVWPVSMGSWIHRPSPQKTRPWTSEDIPHGFPTSSPVQVAKCFKNQSLFKTGLSDSLHLFHSVTTVEKCWVLRGYGRGFMAVLPFVNQGPIALCSGLKYLCGVDYYIPKKNSDFCWIFRQNKVPYFSYNCVFCICISQLQKASHKNSNFIIQWRSRCCFPSHTTLVATEIELISDKTLLQSVTQVTDKGTWLLLILIFVSAKLIF